MHQVEAAATAAAATAVPPVEGVFPEKSSATTTVEAAATATAAPSPVFLEKKERLLREASAGYVAMIADLFAGFNHLFGDFKRGNYFVAIREHPELYLYV